MGIAFDGKNGPPGAAARRLFECQFFVAFVTGSQNGFDDLMVADFPDAKEHGSKILARRSGPFC
jgi:hypothetical protein